MASIYEGFATDQSAEVKGIVLDFGEYGRFTVARAGGSNRAYTKMLEAETRPYRRQIENGLMSAEAADAIVKKVFAHTVVLRWEDVPGEDGEFIPYSRENCLKLLTDLPELFATIRDEAAKAANFRQQDAEGDVKNS